MTEVRSSTYQGVTDHRLQTTLLRRAKAGSRDQQREMEVTDAYASHGQLVNRLSVWGKSEKIARKKSPRDFFKAYRLWERGQRDVSM